jgi:very-short-patch-repair endonuclease
VVHRGVYAAGHRRLSREGHYLAAVLASGAGAVLSHCSAADLWELRASKETRIDVIATTHRRGDRKIRVHANAIGAADTTTHQGITVTTPRRTLLDLAAVVPQPELERAIRQAVYQRLTTTALLAEAVHEHAGRRGVKRLRKTLIHLGEAPGLTRSGLEDSFLRFLRRHSLPMPELNVEMSIGPCNIEADCLWRDERLIVELDGRDAHDSTPAFESDRARDSALTAALWRVVRVTSTRLRHDSPQLAAELRVLLA